MTGGNCILYWPVWILSGRAKGIKVKCCIQGSGGGAKINQNNDKKKILNSELLHPQRKPILLGSHI